MIQDWIGQGFISAEQGRSILFFESARNSGSRSRWVMYGFLILGAIVVSIGCISLIAANWDVIPGMVKLFCDFIILGAAAYSIYRFETADRPLLFDAISAFFSLLCLASIGLISQVFHTGGELWQALLFWIVIILPLVLHGRGGFLYHLWAAAFLTFVLVWAFSNDSWWYTLHDSGMGENSIASLMMMPFMCFFLSSLMGRFSIVERFSKVFQFWAVVFMFVLISFTDYLLSGQSFSAPAGLIPAGMFALASLVLLFVLRDFSGREQVIIFLMTAVTALAYTGIYTVSPSDIKGDMLGALFTIIMLTLFSFIFIIRNNRRIFNIIIFLMGIRFFTVYIQVFGDLATTGIGLILSGVLIIVIAVLWMRRHGSIADWLGERLK